MPWVQANRKFCSETRSFCPVWKREPAVVLVANRTTKGENPRSKREKKRNQRRGTCCDSCGVSTRRKKGSARSIVELGGEGTRPICRKGGENVASTRSNGAASKVRKFALSQNLEVFFIKGKETSRSFDFKKRNFAVASLF